MKFSTRFLTCFLSLLALASAVVARAQIVPVASYSYLTAPKRPKGVKKAKRGHGLTMDKARLKTADLWESRR